MLEWTQDHQALLWWLAVASVVTFVGTLVAIPFLVVRIPPDYFTRAHRPPSPWREHHPVIRAIMIGLKNLVGAAFVAAGVAMLALPGQGVITILIGLMLIDFPGKFRFERWLIRRRPVSRTINWMRRKTHHPPLEMPPAGAADGDTS